MMKYYRHRFVAWIAVLLAALAFTAETSAHDGPVDEDGCHLDQEGREHCH